MKKNIILIGFMGVGKGTTARAFSQKCGGEPPGLNAFSLTASDEDTEKACKLTSVFLTALSKTKFWAVSKSG